MLRMVTLLSYQYCIVKNLVIASILAPAALGYGMATAALHFLAQPAPTAAECGTPGEGPIRCSREGAQFSSDRGSGRDVAICPRRGSRECFPEDLVAPSASVSRLVAL